MNRRDSRGASVLLAALCAAVAAQAQEVHKCTINGQVTYQAKPCPSADVVLPTAPTPSDQEQRQARNDLSRQHWQAATGTIMRPTYVPPPPPPPPPPSPDTSTTTIIVLPSNGVIIRQTKHARSTSYSAPPPPPANNCEKLNRDIAEATERRDQLKAPSELSARTETLAKAEGDVARIRDLAQASNCRLTH